MPSTDGFRSLLRRLSLSRQVTLVNFEVHGSNESNISRYAVSDGETNDIAWHELVCKEMQLLAPVSNDMGMMGDELVKRFKGFFRSGFLDESD